MIELSWTRQPPSTAKVDWSDPLTNRLYLLSFGGRAYDIVGNRVPAIANCAAGVGSSGPALDFTGGASVSYEQYSDTLGNVNEFTVAIVGSIDNPANRQALFTKGEDSPGGEWSLALGYNAGGAYSNFFFQSVQAPSSGADAQGTTPVSAGEPFVVVGTYRRNDVIAIYKNGYLEDTTATGNADLRSDGTSPPLAFALPNVSGGGFSFDGKMALRAIWLRTLSPQEVLALSQNPWRLFEPTRIYVKAPAAPAGLAANPVRGGGAAINPIWGMVA